MLWRTKVCFGFAALALGCSQADAEPQRDARGERYAVFTRLETPDTETSYLGLIGSLDGEAKLDLSQALEVPGASRFYAPESGRFFAVGNNEDFTVTRYDVDDAGPHQTGVLSFAGVGVTRLQHRVVFGSKTRAYYVDNTQAQIVIWNPEAMEIETTVKLPPELVDGRNGYSTVMPYLRLPLVDGRLFIPVAWHHQHTGASRHVTGLVVFDTSTDEVIAYTETTRCAAATELAFDDNGDVYYGTNVNYPFFSTPSAEERAASRPGCVLRVRAGETDFDPDYLLQMSELTGGNIAMGLTDGATPGVAYVQALDEERVRWADIADEDAFWQSAEWRWWRVDLRAQEAVLDDAIPASTPYMTSYEVSGRRFVSRQAADGGSQLFELSRDGQHRASLISPGEIRGLARLR